MSSTLGADLLHLTTPSILRYQSAALPQGGKFGKPNGNYDEAAYKTTAVIIPYTNGSAGSFGSLGVSDAQNGTSNGLGIIKT